MSALALSVLLSLVSAVAYASGAILQEHVAAATPDRPYAPLHHGVWWAAVALNGAGAALHVVALAYGPLSLVQPLGALTIVFALPLAALFVGRRAGRTAWRGALMTSVGLAGLLALTSGSDAHSLAGGERLTLAAVTAGGVGLLFLVAQLIGRPVVRSLLLATAAGVSFGIASVFTKTVAVEWTSGTPALQLPSLSAIAVFAVCGLLLSQASYRGAGLAAPLAMVTVANPVVAAAVGLTLFGEDFRYGTLGAALALVAGAVAAGGLVLLTTERLGAAAREAQRPRGPARADAPEPVAYDTGNGAAGATRVDARHRNAVRPRSQVRPAPAGVPPRGADSDLDAARPQIGERVDVGSVAGPRTHLEVEVRTRAVAGGS
ncbi:MULTISPECIES: DMT family transporter [unclassified Streptomyces]|uniref:DMT family transporter n=1 Tax=unclassified Streptomyces TaxID=2593676 RepID=UPI00382479BD